MGREFVFGLQLVERLVDGEDFLGRRDRLDLLRPELFPGDSSAGLPTAFVTRVLDEHPPHGFGGGGEEVSAAVPAFGALLIDKPHVSLVHQGGGLQRVVGRLVRHPGGGEFAQLVVDQRQQLLGRRRVALFDRFQHAGHIGHSPIIGYASPLRKRKNQIRASG